MTILHLDFYWRSRHPSQADDARRLSRFVNGLPDFDPVYRSWVASPETKEQTVPVPLSEGETMHRLVPQSELVVIPGCGHLAPLQCSAQIGPKVVEFVKR